MILNKRHVAFLDTNVLYTLVSRDILLWFAYYDLFIPKWSQNIFDEWKNVMLRKGLDEREALRRIDRVNQAFPFALVMGYKPIIQTLDLPDQNDRHVLAAAISSGSNYIVTNNLSDFPSKKLNPYGVQVVSVDDFLEIIIKSNRPLAVEALREMASVRKRPEMTEFEVLEQIQNAGLKKTAGLILKEL